MGRAPCCEKMGMKKGPWTPEEDRILINYIRLYGHTNWRALPKQAGLLRCGKSCRLRWINYLRPDIKRGNFTPDEEETIINLHQILGNRWSAIAAKLPGRTDNEIKNVWHTHLKKRIIQNKDKKNSSSFNVDKCNTDQSGEAIVVVETPISSSSSSSPSQSITITDVSTDDTTFDNIDDFNGTKGYLDENLWSDIIFTDNYLGTKKDEGIDISNYSNMYNGDVEFWFGLLTGTGELPDILHF